jgi:hypothetical protein
MPIDPEASMGTLPNGLRYYVRPNPRPANRIELRLVVKAGSVLEDDDQLGLAHFVEHMQFEGTRNFPGQGINQFLASLGLGIGADSNASTSYDETQYSLRIPSDTPDVLDRGLAVLPEPSPGDLFYDIEGDPFVGTGGLEYLHGIGWLEEDGTFSCRALWAHTPAEERKAFEDLIDLIVERRRRHPDMHVYHYAAYEPTALGRLMGRYGTREEELDDLFRGQVFVDLYRVASVADVTVRLERAYAKHLRGDLRGRVESFLQRTGVGLSLGAFGISARLQVDPARDPLPALHALLDLPLRLEASGGFRALVVFDEFQDIGRIDGLDGLLRSHIQHQGEVASYVFAGSEPGLMRLLFETKDRPLYGSAVPMRLGRLADLELLAIAFERPGLAFTLFLLGGEILHEHADDFTPVAPQGAQVVENQGR